MAGYSGTPLPQKLGIKAGARVALVRAPDGFEHALEPLPDGVRLRTQARGTHDVVLFFATRRAELERRFDALRARGRTRGGLVDRVAEAHRGRRDRLTREHRARRRTRARLVDNKVCAVDDTWSGLRFVYRLKDRPRRNGDEARVTTQLARAASGIVRLVLAAAEPHCRVG